MWYVVIYIYMTIPYHMQWSEATTLGHKHRDSQVTSGLPKHFIKDSHPVLQKHANLRALLSLLKLALHYGQSRARHTCSILLEVSLKGLGTTASCANLTHILPAPRY